MANNGEFSKFITEFGSNEELGEKSPETADEIDVMDEEKKKARQNATAGSGRKSIFYYDPS